MWSEIFEKAAILFSFDEPVIHKIADDPPWPIHELIKIAEESTPIQIKGDRMKVTFSPPAVPRKRK
jgi:hypothetical protein